MTTWMVVEDEPGLYELVLAESPQPVQPARIDKLPAFLDWLPEGWIAKASVSAEFRQQLTHQEIRGRFLRLNLTRKPAKTPPGYSWVSWRELIDLPFPRYINAWLEVTGIDDWSPEDVARLQRHLDERRAEELSKDGGEETVDG